MTTGYKWEPWIRTVPVNGDEETFDLNSLFTDAGGPVSVRINYRQVDNNRDDVNRSLASIIYGVRPEVTLNFDIATMEDQAHLATIVNRLLCKSDYTTYLSLDGRVTERAVEVDTMPTPRGFSGKTIGGASFQLRLRCVDLIDTMPDMLADPAEVKDWMENGGLNAWTTGTPDGWSKTETGGTVTEDTTNRREGSSAAALARSGAGTLDIIQSLIAPRIEPNYWAEFSLWAKATAAVTAGLHMRVKNDTTSTWAGPDGKTWQGSFYNHEKDVTTDWQQFKVRFKHSDAAAATGDTFTLRILSAAAADGETIYVDDVKCLHPVPPPGVARW